MSRLYYVIKRFLANIVKRPLPAVASFLSLFLLLLMLDLIWMAKLSADNYLEQIVANIDMELFLEDSLPDSAITYLTEMVEDLDAADTVQFISKDDAREQLSALIGEDLLEGFDDNPLPRSILIRFKSEYLKSGYMDNLVGQLRELTGVYEVYFPGHWLWKVEESKSLARAMAFFLGAVILITVMLNLLYSIRLSIKTHEEGLAQLRLLGGARFLLALPYMLEGIFFGVLSSVAGWLAVFYVSGRISFEGFEVVLPDRQEVVIYCIVAGLAGMVIGYIGLRRSL